MAKEPQQIQENDPETTGHEWDGIKEFNNPLPRWWVWVFYLTIIWGIWYSVAYPAWPGIKEATAGYMGWSTRANVAEEIAAAEAANAGINERLASVELTAIQGDDELQGYATSDKIMLGFFQSITTRTAGFNTVDIGALSTGTTVIFLTLMAIGASPASTGGGIKTTTIAVLLLTVLATVRGKDRV